MNLFNAVSADELLAIEGGECTCAYVLDTSSVGAWAFSWTLALRAAYNQLRS
jgi:hypothetical protein